MRSSVLLDAIILFLAVIVVSQEVQSGNSYGLILAQPTCALGPYEAQSAFTKRFYSRGEYEAARSYPGVDRSRIRYSSDGGPRKVRD